MSEQEESPTASTTKPEIFEVHLGNLDFNTTRDDLDDFIKREASDVTPTNIHLLPSDRNANYNRGYAFVQVSTRDEIDKLVRALNGKELGSRKLTASQAWQQASMPPNRRLRGGRFSGRNYYRSRMGPRTTGHGITQVPSPVSYYDPQSGQTHQVVGIKVVNINHLTTRDSFVDYFTQKINPPFNIFRCDFKEYINSETGNKHNRAFFLVPHDEAQRIYNCVYGINMDGCELFAYYMPSASTSVRRLLTPETPMQHVTTETVSSSSSHLA
jgi:RNA recognition motif-containing protein